MLGDLITQAHKECNYGQVKFSQHRLQALVREAAFTMYYINAEAETSAVNSHTISDMQDKAIISGHSGMPEVGVKVKSNPIPSATDKGYRATIESAMANSEDGIEEAVVPAGDHSDDGNILTPTTSVRSGGTVRAGDGSLAGFVEAAGARQLTVEGNENTSLLEQLVKQSTELGEQQKVTNANLAELIRLSELSITTLDPWSVRRNSQA